MLNSARAILWMLGVVIVGLWGLILVPNVVIWNMRHGNFPLDIPILTEPFGMTLYYGPALILLYLIGDWVERRRPR